MQFWWIERHTYLNVGCGQNLYAAFTNIDYNWMPGILCWDILRPLPFASVNGIYCEHALEHFSPNECLRILKEFRRVLRPGGVVRVVVPDVEMYIDLYLEHRNGKDVVTPYGASSPLEGLNRIMREHGHLYGYDFLAMAERLRAAGFTSITKTAFGVGQEPMLLIDTPERRCESLYVEAVN